VLETELKNLTRMAAGLDTPAMRAGITDREAEISALATKVLELEKGSVHEQITGLRKSVREGLGDIRELITGKHANTAMVKQELRQHIESITLLPE